ncbi:MAG: QacE family quaternary ammonium compound efflux SMR transporter [Porticoccaceae bacterium]|nr:QacE family quaternary ammonium compound efflux SMR transporter [Porticoccaceae bacterium]|tara:strand:+ start:525 stop:860 length:336 start_codon:yes stop_codon:yes gene_type:complete
MAYLFLVVAIIAEVIATSALKASAEFTKIIPSVLALSGYACSLYFLTLVLRDIPLGIAYAIWSGAGIALISLVGFFIYNQQLDFAAAIGIILIISGCVVINIFSTSVYLEK